MKPIYERDWSAYQVRYYLSHWYQYDQRVNDLSEFEKARYIQLYIRLSYLNDKERQLLADQFRRPLNEQLTDAQQAEHMGLNEYGYRKKRACLLRRLQRYRKQPFDREHLAEDFKRLLAAE